MAEEQQPIFTTDVFAGSDETTFTAEGIAVADREIVVKELSLRSHRRRGDNYLDLRNYYDALEIIEDIHSPSIYANLYMNEVVNIISSPVDREYTPGPILGDETINVLFETPNFPGASLELEFTVYSITNRVQSNTKKQSYILHLVPKEFRESERLKLSRTYRNKKYSDAITDILKRDLQTEKKLNIKTSLGNKNFVLPYWSPFKSINWMTSRSLSPDYRGASFLFFESFTGKPKAKNETQYNFMTLEEMYEQEEKKLVETNITNIEDVSDGSVESNEYSLNRANKYDIKKTTNILDGLYTGMFANTLIQHDILNKKFERVEFDYLKTFPMLKHLNRGKITTPVSVENTEYPTQNMSIYPKNFAFYDRTQDDSSNVYIPFRKSQLQQLATVKLLVDIIGDPQLKCGDVVRLELTSPFFSGDVSNNRDRYYAGRYLVTSINHILTPGKTYATTLELHSDTLKIDPHTESEIVL